MVSQSYESQVYDEYVIKGNAAILKCNIPSFVSDHVEITEWIDSNGLQYTRDDHFSGNIFENIIHIFSRCADTIPYFTTVSNTLLKAIILFRTLSQISPENVRKASHCVTQSMAVYVIYFHT